MSTLNQVEPQAHPRTRTQGARHEKVLPTVFIDDLNTITASKGHTQLLADVISAFNAIFATTFAIKKFRAATTATGQGSMEVFDWSWEPTSILSGTNQGTRGLSSIWPTHGTSK